MTLFKLLVAIFVALQVVTGIEYTNKGIAIVGTTESLNIDVTAGASRENIISYEFASYIAVHFAGFNLPDGDSVVISSVNLSSTISHTYTGRGRDPSGTFIASFIPGDSVTVTYKSVGVATPNQGYCMTGFSRGYPTMRHETLCGDGDQTLPAKCYGPGSHLFKELPQAYQKSQAIARMLIKGTYLCTGWLGGSEGHLFTNRNCFEREDWALSTDIEFVAESSSCNDLCERRLGCPGTLVATTSTYIAGSTDIDYAVVQLPACVDLSPYGYLQLRESGPVVNESIYVPQHPDGFAKRIVSTIDGGDSSTIRSVGEDGECGADQVGHDADTKGGSSGSPLIASTDNLVVAMHHCGGCTNRAIDVRTVLTDLTAKNITIMNLVAKEGVGQSSQPLKESHRAVWIHDESGTKSHKLGDDTFVQDDHCNNHVNSNGCERYKHRSHCLKRNAFYGASNSKQPTHITTFSWNIGITANWHDCVECVYESIVNFKNNVQEHDCIDGCLNGDINKFNWNHTGLSIHSNEGAFSLSEHRKVEQLLRYNDDELYDNHCKCHRDLDDCQCKGRDNVKCNDGRSSLKSCDYISCIFDSTVTHDKSSTDLVCYIDNNSCG